MKKYLNSVEEVVKALKAGKEINIEDGIGKYVMDNGTICRLYDGGQILINADIHLNFGTKLYTEEPEPLKFELNRAYKTRKGLKAFLVKICNQHNHMFFLSSEKFVNSPAYCFETNGDGVCVENGFYKKNLKEFDIVALWEEEK